MSKKLKRQEWKEYLSYVKQKGGRTFPIRWKMKIMPQVYGWGAAVVLVGALFKLTHWISGPWANGMLGLGLGVEALIFILSSFEKPHIDPDWSRLYSEFDEDYCRVPRQKSQGRVVTNTSSMGQLGAMENLSDSDLAQLKEGIKKLSETASNMSKLGEAVNATSDYTEALNKATKSVNNLNTHLASIEGDKLQNAMSTYINNLTATAKSAEDFNAKMTAMSKNMESLNKVYGGMLNAMGK